MPLFTTNNSQLKRLKQKQFSKEKEIQDLVETNLNELFRLKFICTEFAPPRADIRIDTLAYDPEQNSFVILEYKKGESWSVIDQGGTYLAFLLDRRELFVNCYNQETGETKTPSDFDWSASRILFISSQFNKFQKGALGFQDLPIELHEVKKYEGNLLEVLPITNDKTSAKLGELQMGGATLKKVREETKIYNIDYHFKNGWESKELFEKFTQELLAIDSRLDIRAVKSYIGIYLENQVVIYMNVNKKKIGLEFSRSHPRDYKDPDGRLEYRAEDSKRKHQDISRFILENEEDIPYALSLAKQALKKY